MECLTELEMSEDGCIYELNGGFEHAEWCWAGHEKECLGVFKGSDWFIEERHTIHFLKKFIEVYTKDLSSDEWWDYKQDCAANIRAAATLIEEIISTLW